jgi:hypothetical protein
MPALRMSVPATVPSLSRAVVFRMPTAAPLAAVKSQLLATVYALPKQLASRTERLVVASPTPTLMLSLRRRRSRLQSRDSRGSFVASRALLRSRGCRSNNDKMTFMMIVSTDVSAPCPKSGPEPTDPKRQNQLPTCLIQVVSQLNCWHLASWTHL